MNFVKNSKVVNKFNCCVNMLINVNRDGIVEEPLPAAVDWKDAISRIICFVYVYNF